MIDYEYFIEIDPVNLRTLNPLMLQLFKIVLGSRKSKRIQFDRYLSENKQIQFDSKRNTPILCLLLSACLVSRSYQGTKMEWISTYSMLTVYLCSELQRPPQDRYCYLAWFLATSLLLKISLEHDLPSDTIGDYLTSNIGMHLSGAAAILDLVHHHHIYGVYASRLSKVHAILEREARSIFECQKGKCISDKDSWYMPVHDRVANAMFHELTAWEQVGHRWSCIVAWICEQNPSGLALAW